MEGAGGSGGSGGDGRRFLHDLGKKLLSNSTNNSNSAQRWSLKEGTQSDELSSLADEMGVALLEKPAKSLKEDIENHSPNTDSPKGLKRSHSKGKSASCGRKFRRTHADKKVNSAHVSPLATCVPHPPFHRHPKTIPRHSTFDDTQERDLNVTDEILDVIQNCISPDLIVDASDEPQWSQRSADEEKECFAVDNLSFCDSCDKKSVGNSDRLEALSPATYLRNDEGAFSRLYDELVVSIFKWLPKKMLVRCMLVCKRWHRLSLDSRLWARACLGGKTLESGVLPKLMERHPIVLRLANSQLVSPVILDDSPCAEWRVQYLDLSAATVSPQCLGDILNRCPSLLRLSLEGLAMCESSSAALGKLVNLKVLNLALTSNLGRVGAESIGLLPRLEALNMAWTRLDERAAEIACRSLPSTVQRLNLSGFRKTLTEKLIKKVVERCPDLVELDISDCVMTGDNLIPILFNLKSLEHLAISRCNGIRRADYVLLQEIPSLQWIDLFGLVSPLTPVTLAALEKLLPKIKFNHFVHSAIARPTVGNRRTSIWGLRTKD